VLFSKPLPIPRFSLHVKPPDSFFLVIQAIKKESLALFAWHKALQFATLFRDTGIFKNMMQEQIEFREQ